MAQRIPSEIPHRAIRVPSCALDSNRLPKNTRVRASDDFSSTSIRMGSSFLRQNGQFFSPRTELPKL